MNTQNLSISARAMLLEMTIAVYTGRRTDKRTAEEVTTAKGAGSKSATSVAKHLFAGDKDLQAINQWAQHSRSTIAAMTMPWNDSGVRLMPTAAFFDVNAKLNELRDEFYVRVDNFVSNYQSKVSNAAFALGQLFDRSEYPDAAEIRSKFRFDFTFGPVPDVGDFRVDIPDEALDQVRAQFSTMNNERVEQAVGDVIERLFETIKTLQYKCTTPEDGPKPRFHESTLEQAKELCQIVKSLNLFDDPGIEEVRAELEASIGHLDIDTLRESTEARESVKSKMDDLLSRFQ